MYMYNYNNTFEFVILVQDIANYCLIFLKDKQKCKTIILYNMSIAYVKKKKCKMGLNMRACGIMWRREGAGFESISKQQHVGSLHL